MAKGTIHRIGVLTSGGDAPGMNAAIRAVVRCAAGQGIETWGIRRGYAGLCEGEILLLTPRSVANILHRGGTVLETSRHEEMKTVEGRRSALRALSEARLNGLIIIGGNGTIKGAAALAKEGTVPIVCVPSTIDNDVCCTDYTIGFDTAVNTALEAIDRIRDTAESLPRLFFIEVMGRERGFIALEVGIACGADAILIPETETSLDSLSQTLAESLKRGKRSPIVVVAEGEAPGGALAIAHQVKARTGVDYRVCVLGYVQRGGSPTARDRILASRLGAVAVDALLKGKHGYLVGLVKGEITLTPLEEAAGQTKALDSSLVPLALRLAI